MLEARAAEEEQAARKAARTAHSAEPRRGDKASKKRKEHVVGTPGPAKRKKGPAELLAALGEEERAALYAQLRAEHKAMKSARALAPEGEQDGDDEAGEDNGKRRSCGGGSDSSSGSSEGSGSDDSEDLDPAARVILANRKRAEKRAASAILTLAQTEHGGGLRPLCSFTDASDNTCAKLVWKGGRCAAHGARPRRRPSCSFVYPSGKRCTSNAQRGELCAAHDPRPRPPRRPRPSCTLVHHNGNTPRPRGRRTLQEAPGQVRKGDIAPKRTRLKALVSRDQRHRSRRLTGGLAA